MNTRTQGFVLAVAGLALAAVIGGGQAAAQPASATTLVNVTGVSTAALQSHGITLAPATRPAAISARQATATVLSVEGGHAFPIVSVTLADASDRAYAMDGGHMGLCWVVVAALPRISHTGQRSSVTVFFVDATSGRYMGGVTGSGF